MQLALEEDLVEYSLNKYWRGLESSLTSSEPEQDLIQDYIRQCTDTYKELIDMLLKDTRSKLAPLVIIPPDILAGIVITQIIEDLVDSSNVRKKIHHNGVDNAWSVAYRIGREVKMILGFRMARETPEGDEHFKYLERYTKSWRKRKRDSFAKKFNAVPEWSKKETLLVGSNLLAIAKAHGIVNIEMKYSKKNKRYNEISIDPNVMLELIRRHEQLQFLRLVYRPMISPPVPHTLELPGAALSLDRRKPTVGGLSKASQEHLDSLNHLQQTEWTINERVLEVMETVYRQNNGHCNMPASDFEDFTFLRPYPENGTPDERRAWKLDKTEQYSKWYKEVQKRAQMEIRLSLAKKMKELGFFYHGYTCDFRGRSYTVTEMLSPQSGDFDRGLIKFATPCQVTKEGMYWLMVHVANCCDGMSIDGDEVSDKMSFDERVQWVKRQEKILRKISEDPYANSFWMDNETTKKNPSFQRLAAICDFVHALDTGKSYVPVQLDGSCNGSQHWSAIMRDLDIAKLVNVSPTDRPGDLYQYVADIGTDICASSDGTWPQVFYEHWDHRIPRKVFKRSTMCDAYGITDHGIRRYAREEGHLDWIDDGSSKTQAVNELAVVIRSALDGALESSNAGKIFLQTYTELCGNLGENGKFVEWITPSGFKVINRYNEPKIKIQDSQFYRSKGGVRLRLNTIENSNKVNTQFAVQAIPPNFIHSLDAAHMMAVIARMFGRAIINTSFIHDSFGCACNDVPEMRQFINEEFYNIHKENQLEVFAQHANKVLGYNASLTLPKRGNLNIESVLQSEYLFG